MFSFLLFILTSSRLKSGYISFIYSQVRDQRNGGKFTKSKSIREEFGEDASLVLEPFLRCYIPKFFNESPNIDQYEDFIFILSRRILLLEILPYEDFFLFLSHGGKNSVGRCLFHNYELFMLLICKIIYSELINPSYRGFGLYLSSPVVYGPTNALESLKFIHDMERTKVGPFEFLLKSLEDGCSLSSSSILPSDIITIIRSCNLPKQPILIIFGFLYLINQHAEMKNCKKFCQY